MEGMAPLCPLPEPQTIPEQETWNVGSRGCLLSCGVSIAAWLGFKIGMRFEVGAKRSLPLLSITMEGMAPPCPILEPQIIPKQET